MATPLTTLPLNPRDHWAFFHAAAPVSPADRQLIAALDEDSALHVWDEVVGQPVPATVVVKHGRTLDELARNQLDDRFSASAAIVGRDLVLRGEKNLYCLREAP